MPEYSANLSLPDGPQIPCYGEGPPPPGYIQLVPSPPAALPAAAAQQQDITAAKQGIISRRTTEQDKCAVEAILRLYGWRPLWGPRPRSLEKALSRSALAGNEPLVRALLSAGAVIYKPNLPTASSAMHEAVRGPNPALSLLLLEHGYESAFRQARERGAAAEEAVGAARGEVKRLLAATDRNRCTPLHLAARAGVADLMTDFLYLGAEIDPVDVFGRTPLHMAARYNREEAIACLLDHEADPGMVDEVLWQGLAPENAAELGDWEFIKRTLAHACEEKERRDGTIKKKDEGSEHDHAPANAAKWGLSDSGKRVRAGVAVGGNRLARGAGTETLSSSAWRPVPKASTETAPLNLPATFLEPSRRPVRQRPPSITLSPQFMEWKRTCETLQEEHRRQRERDRRAEIPLN